MPKPLVIVESPAKAKTIGRILGSGYVVESSIGHIRDLPPTASEIPAAYKAEPWARLGVDVHNDFKPLYVVPKKKKQQVTKLKGLLKDAAEVYLATDEDREGESIAWHLLEVLSPRVPVKRMVFHEITPQAISAATRNPRDLDRRLVDAQEARRILDRLYGYEVSPVLWKKVLPKLSAGRVQSVATRIIVERERDRIAFRAATYWDVKARVRPEGGVAGDEFDATVVAFNGTRLATGRDFDAQGKLKSDALVLDGERAAKLAEDLRVADVAVASVQEKPFTRSPYAPFITSTLQQESGRKLGFTAQRTMSTAQRLYENGYITYMRTDSTTLSQTAVAAARSTAERLYGGGFVADKPRLYTRKVKNAQEAHEAIRPAGDTFRTLDEVAPELAPDERRLYELIWKRTVASQMSDARGQSLQVRLSARAPSGDEAELAATGKTLTFAGFLRAYVEGADDPDAQLEDQEVRLPALSEEERLDVAAVEPLEHRTTPPPRYTEASLVKRLEELGVGRPSTYASIIGTILDRGYVWKKGSALVPSYTAFAVVNLLEAHFPQLVDYGFTADMEGDLDEIASGDEEMVPWLRRFYFGNGAPGLHDLVSTHLDEIDPRAVNSIPLGTVDGDDVVVRVGRYGPYLQKGDQRASLPDDIAPDELTVEKALELLDAPSGDRVLGGDPATGEEVVLRAGRYGPYVQLGEPEEGSKKRPPTASLFKSMDPAIVTLDDALRLLSLPRAVGVDPATGEEITAQNGRFGPYLKRGSDTRSLQSEEQIFEVTLDEALALFAEPKRGRGRGVQAPPLKELGADPVTGAPMVVKTGRFGPYITDGKVNASLPKNESVEDLTVERAAELLARKREKVG